MFDPWFTKFIESLQAEDDAFFGANEKELSEIFEKDRLIAYLMEKFPPPLEEQAVPRREAMAEAYNEMEKSLESMELSEEFEESFFGVNGFTLFQNYGFKETLILPGEVLSTNANIKRANTLIWEFDSADFLMKDYTLHASSRLINSGRIAWVAGGAVLTLISLVCIFLKRCRKQV